MTSIVSSSDHINRSLALLLWGPAGSRKTETALRYFPRPFVLDVEGKAHHAIGVDGVNEFLLHQTKDVYDILDDLDKLSEGKITFPDGQPVETVCIDSGSVLWSVRQEAGSLMAEERAERYARGSSVDPDQVTMTMLDWTKVKRPLKRLMTKLNNSPVKYFIITAREKPLYEEVTQGGKTELKRVGETPDIQRGVDYEVDVAFRYLPGPPWKCRVTRTRGKLEELLPLGSEYTEFPRDILIEYATGVGPEQEDELSVAARQAEGERTKTQSELIDYGREKGLDGGGVAEALKGAGINKFDAKRWDEMTQAIDDAAE